MSCLREVRYGNCKQMLTVAEDNLWLGRWSRALWMPELQCQIHESPVVAHGHSASLCPAVSGPAALPSQGGISAYIITTCPASSSRLKSNGIHSDLVRGTCILHS